jgi:glycosyltransferase involved in cell wall biosynthesis
MNNSKKDNFFSSQLENRERIVGIDRNLDFEITVFVGLYNAMPYLDEIYTSLHCQIEQKFAIVLVDNNSTDGTWEKIQSWKELFFGRITLIRNPINVGGTANLYFALDEVDTDWFTQFHQDDRYLENHLSTIIQTLKSIDNNVIAISTDMGSISEGGYELPIKSRSAWLLSNKTRPEIFIANVFVHSIYWPSTAFKKSAYKSIYAPWHSATFPDTEILLRLCAHGDFVIVSKKTMFYRENPSSDSHSLSKMESTLGAGLGLIRVFESKEFEELIKSCDPEFLSSFFLKLRNGIEFRTGNPEIAQLIYVFALEKANMAFDYGNQIILEILLVFYRTLDATRTANLLENLLPKTKSHREVITPAEIKIVDTQDHIMDQNIETQIEAAASRTRNAAIMKILGLLPYRLQVLSMKILLRLKIKLNSKHPWDFDLKKNH